MAATTEMLRFYVYTQYKAGLTTDVIHRTLLQIHGEDKAPGKSTVYRWVKEINDGTFEFSKSHSCGKPRRSGTESLVSAVQSKKILG